MLKKYILLLKISDSNCWQIAQDYTDDGAIKSLNCFFDSPDEAEKCAKEIIEFDEEENGKAIEDENYIIQRVPFDPNIPNLPGF